MRRRPLDDPRLQAFELLGHAVWITDPDAPQVIWGNRAALALWLADDLDELVNRDFSTTSETARITLRNLRDRVAAGQRVRSERTVYPRDTPVFVEMSIGAYPLPDGRVGLLVEGQAARGPRPDPDIIRGAEAARYAPLALSTHSRDGETLTRNACASRMFGSDMRFDTLFERPEDAARCWQALFRDGELRTDALLCTTSGPRWHTLDARTMPDPVTGQQMVVLSLHDITKRVEAESAKDDFIAVINHELRTPLTSIRGALGLLLAGAVDERPDERQQLMQIADDNCRRLGELIDDLLDVQRILAYEADGGASGQGLSLRRRVLDLRPLIEQAVQLVTAPRHGRRAQICCELPEQPTLIEGDERRLRQVISHLLVNAIKYGPEGGTITVALTCEEGRIHCEVRDEGRGVPAAFRSRLFQRFSQADSSTQRSSQGTGLGLFLSRHIVEAHGGRIGYDAGSSGGSRFFFTLPVAPETERAAPRSELSDEGAAP
ncbi:MAG: HAMP domain-containing sensor histidine kinase [Polyangia bacterium]